MNNNGFMKVWNVMYPILMYYVVSNIAIYLAVLALSVTGRDYSAQYMMLQTIAAAVCLPVLYNFYKKDKLFFTVFQQRMSNALTETPKNIQLLNGVLTFACGAAAGFALNNIITATGLTGQSASYQNVTTQFFAGGIFFEILGSGLLIPVVEELLYRGIVYGRLADWIGIPSAAIGSAVIFGALHFNLVQFIYAAALGLLLVFFMEKCHSLYGAVLGHVGANLLTIFRVESGALDWLKESAAAYWGTTAAAVLFCAALVLYMSGKLPRKK